MIFFYWLCLIAAFPTTSGLLFFYIGDSIGQSRICFEAMTDRILTMKNFNHASSIDKWWHLIESWHAWMQCLYFTALCLWKLGCSELTGQLLCQSMWKNTYVWSKNPYGYFKYWRYYPVQPYSLVSSSPTDGWRQMAWKTPAFSREW